MPSAQPRRLTSRFWTTIGILALLLAVLAALDHRTGPATELQRLLPDMDPVLVRYLARGDIDAARRFCREKGDLPLVSGIVSIMEAYPLTLPEFLEAGAVLHPASLTLASAIEREKGVAFHRRALVALHGRPPEEQIRAIRLYREGRQVALDPAVEPRIRIDRMKALIEAARPYSDVINLGDLYSVIIGEIPKLGRNVELVELLESAAKHSLEFGDTTTACQYLGTLGIVHYQQDSTKLAIWDHAIALARAAGSWQEARLYFMLGGHYLRVGDLAMAAEMMARAESRSRELGADVVELRFLLEHVSLMAAMSCWDMVDRELLRADLLYQRGLKHWTTEEESQHRLVLDTTRMRALAARGEEEIAVTLARKVLEGFDAQPVSAGREKYVGRITALLAQFGHFEEARQRSRESLRLAEVHKMGAILNTLLLSEAEVCNAQGDTAAMADALRRFREVQPRDGNETRLWAIHDQFYARLLSRTAGARGAIEAIAVALEFIEQDRDLPTASPEMELNLSASRYLRTLFHDVSKDPVAGYLFELSWPRLFAGRGRAAGPPDPSETARQANEGLLELPHLDESTIHCVYYWGERELVRWTRRGSSVTRDVLVTELQPLNERLDRFRRKYGDVTRAAGMPRGRDIDELHSLARLLLPAEMLEGTAEPRLLVTRNGSLTWIPFEMLSLARDKYRPVLAGFEVAYTSTIAADPHASAATSLPAAPLVILSEPAYDPEDLRRMSTLAVELPHGVREASEVSITGGPILHLRGEAATRRAFMSACETAGRVYVASHFVEDPDASYLRYLPLAPDTDGRRLDLRSIRRMDVSSCSLVVLSGCGTAARYWNGFVELPSLAEGFLMAGARDVVGTLWDVRDEEGARMMRAFDEEYARTPGDPVGSLTRARRRLLAEREAPRIWAVYNIFSNDFLTYEGPLSSSYRP